MHLISFILNMLFLAIVVSGVDDYTRADFPESFVFGAGSSAYQVGFFLLFFFFIYYLFLTNLYIHTHRQLISDGVCISLYFWTALNNRWKEQLLKMEGRLAFGIPMLIHIKVCVYLIKIIPIPRF